jgi:hypothetical protein
MALEPFVGPWPLFEFPDSIHNRYDLMDRGSARHKASTYTQNNTIRINTHHTDINASSGTRTHDPSVRASEDGSCPSPHGQCPQ